MSKEKVLVWKSMSDILKHELMMRGMTVYALQHYEFTIVDPEDSDYKEKLRWCDSLIMDWEDIKALIKEISKAMSEEVRK